MHELDRDTELLPIGEGRFSTTIGAGWGIYANPHGGYLGVLMSRALGRVLPHPDPLVVGTQYLFPPRPGPAEIHVEVLRTGRNHSTGIARLVQEEKTRLACMATFCDLTRIEGPTREEASMPHIPPLDECELRSGEPPGSTFTERFEMRFSPGAVSFLDGAPKERMEIAAWMRLRDGREPDAGSLILYADALPPPALHAVTRVWVPTIELTVQVRRRPSPGWIRGFFRTRFLIDGYLEEDGELWDAQGRLVALSRQLARVQRQ